MITVKLVYSRSDINPIQSIQSLCSIMIFNLFREESAHARSARQRLDHLLIVSAPIERVVLGVVAAVLATFVLWAIFGSVSRSVAFEGVTIAHGQRHEVSAIEPGNLVEFLVNPNDEVSIGDPIARQTIPELDREISFLLSLEETTDEQLRQSGNDGTAKSVIDSFRATLLHLEARRSAREIVVSQVDGIVASLNASLGDYLYAGRSIAQIFAGDTRTLLAVSQVEYKIARLIDIGMSAVIDIELPDGSFHHAKGEVLSIASEPVPYWLAVINNFSDSGSHRLEIGINPSSEFELEEGMRCLIRVDLGRTSPISLLGTLKS